MTEAEHKKKMPLPKCQIYKMKSNFDDYRIEKRSTFNLPMKLLVIGKSELSGKTNAVCNLLSRPWGPDDLAGVQFYLNDFDGDDMYIISPSTLVDYQWRKVIYGKRIPDHNIYNSYNEEELERLYDKLEKQHYEKPRHKLVVFDDVSYGGGFKSKLNGVMAKFFCNGRHFLISTIVTSQKYSDCATCMRENATGMMIFSSSLKQMELIYNDIGECPKPEFMKMFRAATKERHSFMVVNFSNDYDERFLNQYFQPIEYK